jgi:hypothetical protein
MMITLVKNTVTFEIDTQPDYHSKLSVIAKLDGKTARGQIPGTINRSYPRIEFYFNHDQWLHELADKRSWILDDFETGDDAEKRPTDYCEFALTEAEIKMINAARGTVVTTPVPAPANNKTNNTDDTDSGLGIGGINNDQSLPTIPSEQAIERVQKLYDTDIVCKHCGASKNFGGMFTTLAGGNICDDCA